MNKYTKKFILAALVTLTGVAGAATNKTHYQPRPAGVNLAMERTTWHTQINKKIAKEDDKFGASLQAVGFYEESTKGDSMGKYFGFNNNNKLTIGAGDATKTNLIDRRHLIHDYNNSHDPKLASTLNLNFEHRQGGVRFDYFQDLDGVLKGLYFHVNAPIVWSQTRSNLNVCDETKSAITGDEATKGAADYFCCGLIQTGSNTQAALEKAKICGNKSKTSLADIDFKLGWNFWETAKHHAGINIGVTFPTSPDAKGEYLFEPMGGGNGQHWGLGAGLDVKVRPWTKDEQNIELQLVANYRYLFEGSDTRTLGLKKSSSDCCIGDAKSWGHYFLGAKVGEAGVFPMANILTQKVDVKVGSQFDMLAGVAYNNGNFTLDLGYELFARESESVSKKSSCAFEDNAYGLAGNDYDATYVFGNTAAAGNANSGAVALSAVTISATAAQGQTTGAAYLQNSDIVTSVAETPSQVTHKIYGGLGYSWNEWETPLMLGLGAEYEFGSSQKSLTQWGIFGKVGVSF